MDDKNTVVICPSCKRKTDERTMTWYRDERCCEGCAESIIFANEMEFSPEQENFLSDNDS